jgi:hypothetical protein
MKLKTSMQQILFHWGVKKSDVLSNLTILWHSELNYEPRYKWIQTTVPQGNAVTNINIKHYRQSVKQLTASVVW